MSAARPAAILPSNVSIAALAEDSIAANKRNPAFIKWLTIFFADRGSYQLTAKAIEELGSQYRNGGKVAQRSTIGQRKINAQVRVESLIAEHGAEWVTEKGYINLPNQLPMQDLAGRRIIISNLVRLSGGNPRGITVASFRNNNLSGFLSRDFYRGSPYDVLAEGGFVYSVAELVKASAQGKFETAKLYPWEFMRNPKIYPSKTRPLWGRSCSDFSGLNSGACSRVFDNNPEVRIAAVRWLVSKLGKDVRELARDDFRNHNIDGVLRLNHNGSHYSSLVEAGYAYSLEEALTASALGRFETAKIYPWEMKVSPSGLFDKPESRIAATRWLVSKLGKDVRTLSEADFIDNHLGGFVHDYNSSPYAALVEAGYAYSVEEMLATSAQGRFDTAKIYPWEMDTKTPTGFFDRPERRIAAVKWLAWKLGKDVRKITGEDFKKNRLRGVLNYYNSSPRAAFAEAGLITP